MSSRERMTKLRRRQAALAIRGLVGGLPMPHGRLDTKLTATEILEYHERRRQHHEAHPDYIAGWERPLPETARAIYDLLKQWLPPLDTIHPDPVTAMQLIVVALDQAVIAGRYGHRVEIRPDEPEALERRVMRTVGRNNFFDALARRWSDHARLAREEDRAYTLAQMTPSTIAFCRRDLLVNEINLPALWTLTVNTRLPLYTARQSIRLYEEDGETGYRITLKKGPILRLFERAVRRDRAYRDSRLEHTWRLWIVGKRRPRVPVAPAICAERRFNDVTVGPQSRAVLTWQERVRLDFNVRFFVIEYRALAEDRRRLATILKAIPTPKGWPWRAMPPDERELRKLKQQITLFLREYRAVYEQVRGLKADTVPIRSAFVKVLNRRFQNLHLFPMMVRNRPDHPTTVEKMPDAILSGALPALRDEGDPIRLAAAFTAAFRAPRTRWFWSNGYPLASLDVSASQTQIQAVLLNHREMEEDATQRPHKIGLAARAWAAHEQELADGNDPLLIGYTGPDDHRLIEMMKNLWMLLGYGPPIVKIIRAQEKNPALYGRGWRRRIDGMGRKVRDVRTIQGVLASVPGYQERHDFLEDCKRAGLAADRYTGITLVDPLDGEPFTWNPVLRGPQRMAFNDWELTPLVPGTWKIPVKPGRYENATCPECGVRGVLRGTRWRCWRKHVWPGEWNGGSPNEAGVYPTDEMKLKKMVAPCLIHTLDALFSAYVMAELKKDGVPAFVGIHDCWAVADTVERPGRAPERGYAVLERAIERAGEPWLRALGPVYDWMADHLEPRGRYEGLREAWRQRVAEQRWPHFLAKPSGPP